MEQQTKRIIISGGGTGGHIFPALAIANALKLIDQQVDILFVGALGRMEMEKVPAAGYKITGLPVAGFQRKFTFKNIIFFYKLWSSMIKANRIIREFKPHVAVGVGGYASGPILRAAAKKGIPTIIQEQNSYAGVTNRILSHNAKTICVAYEGMEKFFPSNKIVLTGNPVRLQIIENPTTHEEACAFFELQPKARTILISGGSLGALTINQAIFQHLDILLREHLQIIWQTGKNYFEMAKLETLKYSTKSIRVFEFIDRMDMAYRAADLVICRAGALTISELCLLGKPAILVPSPNVAEDHQTKNAMALVERNAAIMIADHQLHEALIGTIKTLINDDTKLSQLSENCHKMAIANSDLKIAEEVLKLIKKRE